MNCVFCQRSDKSREHVIPRWTDASLRASQRPAPDAIRAPVTNRYTPPPGSDLVGYEWPSDVADLVTTDVCVSCNTGWLHDLETAVRPILEPMIVGSRVLLDTEAQRTMAMWSYKTVLLMQLVRPERLRPIPEQRYRDLHSSRRPPSDVRLWLGRTGDGPAMHEATTESDLATLTTTTPGYLSIITLGDVLVVCAGRVAESSEPARFSARSERDALLPIWPASLRTISWPPSRVIEDLAMAEIVKLI